MVFSSVLFLFEFLPITFLIYYLVPFRAKNTVLFLASLVFYSWGEVRYFPIMLCVILANYFAALVIEKKRGTPICSAAYWAAVIFNFAMLGFFKYADFLTGTINSLFGTALPMLNLTLPLGISFYTFQITSYTIDVHRGDVPAEHNFIDFGAFVVLFPQLIAGPIVRYTDVYREMHERTITLAQMNRGAELFLLGLASKTLIANNIGALWTDVEALGFSSVSTPLAWLALAAYTLQIYFDFSGYSLMAIGMGYMLGFNFPKNFDFPYESRTITEFWGRWHMTLGQWFREYVYIPLGGNRLGKARQYLNIFIVWALTGLWHGASWNFVIWGLYYGILLVLEKSFWKTRLEKSRILSHIYVMVIVSLGWGIFALTDFSALGELFTRLFSFTGGEDWLYFLRNYAVTFVLAVLLSTKVLKAPFERITQNRVLALLVYGALFFVCTAYLVDATYNPFLYFRF